jgi:hypothetical protein
LAKLAVCVNRPGFGARPAPVPFTGASTYQVHYWFGKQRSNSYDDVCEGSKSVLLVGGSDEGEIVQQEASEGSSSSHKCKSDSFKDRCILQNNCNVTTSFEVFSQLDPLNNFQPFRTGPNAGTFVRQRAVFTNRAAASAEADRTLWRGNRATNANRDTFAFVDGARANAEKHLGFGVGRFTAVPVQNEQDVEFAKSETASAIVGEAFSVGFLARHGLNARSLLKRTALWEIQEPVAILNGNVNNAAGAPGFIVVSPVVYFKTKREMELRINPVGAELLAQEQLAANPQQPNVDDLLVPRAASLLGLLQSLNACLEQD